MATFHRAANGIGWLKISWLELALYSDNLNPICDDCGNSLAGHCDVVLVPLLNQAYCPKCGEKLLARMVNYPEDREIASRRERFWSGYFSIPIPEEKVEEGG